MAVEELGVSLVRTWPVYHVYRYLLTEYEHEQGATIGTKQKIPLRLPAVVLTRALGCGTPQPVFPIILARSKILAQHQRLIVQHDNIPSTNDTYLLRQ